MSLILETPQGLKYISLQGAALKKSPSDKTLHNQPAAKLTLKRILELS